ncbi:hypothetical protein D083_1241 [Dickeya solani RNS 08.23.3.1.A]|nr:hypothetical protein D083_1241 [Dickeya solani RNS 08.23.3.1.A]
MLTQRGRFQFHEPCAIFKRNVQSCSLTAIRRCALARKTR